MPILVASELSRSDFVTYSRIFSLSPQNVGDNYLDQTKVVILDHILWDRTLKWVTPFHLSAALSTKTNEQCTQSPYSNTLSVLVVTAAIIFTNKTKSLCDGPRVALKVNVLSTLHASAERDRDEWTRRKYNFRRWPLALWVSGREKKMLQLLIILWRILTKSASLRKKMILLLTVIELPQNHAFTNTHMHFWVHPDSADIRKWLSARPRRCISKVRSVRNEIKRCAGRSFMGLGCLARPY